MKGRQIISMLLLMVPSFAIGQKNFILKSPSGKIVVTIGHGDSTRYKIDIDGKLLIAPSAIALITERGLLGINPKVRTKSSQGVHEMIIHPVPAKRKDVPDHYNELTIRYHGSYSIIFRAYDDGVAYRFETSFKDSLIVHGEIATFQFANTTQAYFPQVQQRADLDRYHTSFEEPYRILTTCDITPQQLCFTPALFDDNTSKVFLTESDLSDYPGMFLRGTSSFGVKGDFAPASDKEEVQGGEFRQWVAASRKPYLAKTNGTRNYPWRVIGIARDDRELISNDIVFRLGKPAEKTDWSWVRPGMATDEWICGINLYNVPFKAGINTETYKYYIDFASHFGMQYVMLDAGWSDYDDLFKLTPGLDLVELARYAKTRNIGLLLWTLSMTLDKQLEPALERFAQLGIRGLLTDFMDRDDQKVVRFYERVAQAAAKRKLMVMYHGAFKNAGMERTYPNAITREAILGSEYNIWSDKATPDHDLMIPFIRMLSGPLDYEPGFYNNANQKTFKPLSDMVMSQGTRVHQLAMFVAYDSPLQIFSGNPSDAYTQPDYTSYLASIPTSWDETKALHAKVGDYLVVARRKGNDWYIAGMTDWTPRDFEVDLSFLSSGKYTAQICQDGINAARNARDYQIKSQVVDSSYRLTINISAGGGYVVKLMRMP